MIIARLQGGLGNQLFQYAAAKALATRLNRSFKLDAITSLKGDKLRQIALHQLEAGFELATKSEIRKFVFFPTLYRHKPALFSKIGRRIYRERSFSFDQKFLRLRNPIFLDGFWQSPRYFEDIESIIRDDFQVRPELIKKVVQKGNELSAAPSIAVHVRRGDFLNPKIAAYHGVLEPGYYEKAIELVKQKIPNATVHFFSDDIEWVKENIPAAASTEFVSSPNRSAIEDFYLMTRCQHHIIANSSFSWWTAWLNDKPGKIVVAPKSWFAVDLDTKDLIPRDWIQI
jgi:hypothetical protein